MAAPPFQTKLRPVVADDTDSLFTATTGRGYESRGRWKAGRSPITPTNRGVSLEHGPTAGSGLNRMASRTGPKPNVEIHRRQQSFTGLEPCRGALQGARRCCHQRLPSLPRLIPQPAKPNRGSHKGNSGIPADGRSCVRPPSAGSHWCAFTGRNGQVSLRFGTGVEPVTARLAVWCSFH